MYGIYKMVLSSVAQSCPYSRSYLQSRKRHTDIENKCLDTKQGRGMEEFGDWNWHVYTIDRLPWWLSVKKSTCQFRRWGLVPGLGRSPAEGNDNPLQYSSLGNPMDVMTGLQSMGLQKSWTWLNNGTI